MVMNVCVRIDSARGEVDTHELGARVVCASSLLSLRSKRDEKYAANSDVAISRFMIRGNDDVFLDSCCVFSCKPSSAKILSMQINNSTSCSQFNRTLLIRHTVAKPMPYPAESEVQNDRG